MDTSTIRPRRPWLAVLLAFFQPGLGQLYNGQVNRAAWYFLLFLTFASPAAALLVVKLPDRWTIVLMLGSLALSVLVWLIGVLDAFSSARRRREYVPQAWQGTGSYLLVWVLAGALALPLLSQYVRKQWVEPFRIPSASMEPTLVAGDFIYADKRFNCPGCGRKIQRGDVITFLYPNDHTTSYIKRAIGLPGDRIQIKGQVVFVNGKPMSAKPVLQNGIMVVREQFEGAEWIAVWKKPEEKLVPVDLLVPPGQVFVLGDNRNNSNDSRFFGTVPLGDVTGRARQIWLSYNATLGGLQLERSGRLAH